MSLVAQSPERLLTTVTTRRALLRGTALLSISGLLAACGSSNESSEPAADSSPQGSGTMRVLDGEPVKVWRDPG